MRYNRVDIKEMFCFGKTFGVRKFVNPLLDCLQQRTGRSMDLASVRGMHPLVLAYIGDTVYDLFVRTYLVHAQEVSVHQLHTRAVSYVKAASQSDTLLKIEGLLTEEERDVVRRGRNAKSGTIPKHADMAEYRRATGFESLLGFLFLTGQEERLYEILGHRLDTRASRE